MDSKIRLSDRILNALDLSIEQEDVEISDLLVKALEKSMTRSSGGGEFVERRDYPKETGDILDRLSALKKANK